MYTTRTVTGFEAVLRASLTPRPTKARFCERVGAPSVLRHVDVGALEDRLGFTNVGTAEEPIMHYVT